MFRSAQASIWVLYHSLAERRQSNRSQPLGVMIYNYIASA